MAATEAAEGGAEAGGGLAIDPMHQFVIERIIPMKIGNIDFSFTNSSLYMVVAVLGISALMLMGSKSRTLVPGRLQSVAEMAYEFIADMVRSNCGEEGMKYFPYIFSLFMFVLFANMIGMIPYTFTVTSHIIVTFAMAMAVFITVTVVGVVKNGVGFLKLFAPSGVPMALMPLMIVIEVISYLSRPISLSVRLFANMMAGHAMLKVFGGFVVALGAAFGWVPLALMVGLTGLEFLVAFLQAFVFAMLSCIYLSDALHPAH